MTTTIKALQLLKSNKSVAQRAEQYATSMKRNIQRDVIDSLTSRIEDYNDKIFELSNFTLDTNLNQGLKSMTKEDCEKRFKDLIECEYQVTLLKAELKVKQASFNNYFEEETSQEA